MAVFAISDLHLALGKDKPMDIFGSGWHNYMERIQQEWNKRVQAEDLVLVGGDVSWATYLEDALEDLKFIEALNGKKLLLKGNHDYWWESKTKLDGFVREHAFSSIEFLHNNAFLYESYSIAGTRGWLLPGSDAFRQSDRKIYNRELIRLELSLQCAVQEEQKLPDKQFTRIAMLHYPPVTANGKADEEILQLLKQYDVTVCFYGHLHGTNAAKAYNGTVQSILFRLVSADIIDFIPCNLDFLKNLKNG